jgi:hypothetical protein
MPPVEVRKKYGYSLCAANGSNKVIACSKADWGPVRDGSYILIHQDTQFYRVIGKSRFIYQKEVAVLSGGTQLKVNEPVGTMLGVDDDISFSHNEYNIISAEIDSGGEGYKVGDSLTPEGGAYKYNSIDQIDVPSSITVKSVNGSGAITSVALTSGGKYNVAPDNSCSVSSGSGEGATLNITSKMADIIHVEDRTITSIEKNQDNTIIQINHALPPRVESGMIKANKWELLLNIDYAGENKDSVNYQIIKDFTPHNNIPLINADMGSNHIAYNEAVSIIDQKIKDLEDRLGS